MGSRHLALVTVVALGVSPPAAAQAERVVVLVPDAAPDAMRDAVRVELQLAGWVVELRSDAVATDPRAAVELGAHADAEMIALRPVAGAIAVVRVAPGGRRLEERLGGGWASIAPRAAALLAVTLLEVEPPERRDDRAATVPPSDATGDVARSPRRGGAARGLALPPRPEGAGPRPGEPPTRTAERPSSGHSSVGEEPHGASTDGAQSGDARRAFGRTTIAGARGGDAGGAVDRATNTSPRGEDADASGAIGATTVEDAHGAVSENRADGDAGSARRDAASDTRAWRPTQEERVGLEILGAAVGGGALGAGGALIAELAADGADPFPYWSYGVAIGGAVGATIGVLVAGTLAGGDGDPLWTILAGLAAGAVSTGVIALGQLFDADPVDGVDPAFTFLGTLMAVALPPALTILAFELTL